MNTKAPYEGIGVVATIDPDAYGASTVVSDYVNVEDWRDGIMAIVTAGTLGTNATIDAKLRQATDASGTGVKDITGKEITQLTQAGTDESDRQAIIFVRPDELDVAGGFTHVALSLTVGTATSDAGAVVLGVGPRHTPAAEYDLASVAEIVD